MPRTLTAPDTSLRCVSQAELARLTGLSLPTLWRMRRRGDLPAPVQLSPGRVAWPYATIRDWLDARERSSVGAQGTEAGGA